MKKKSRVLTIITTITLLFSLQTTVFASTGSADSEESINEKYGLPIVAYGEALSSSQKEETKKLLGVKENSKVEEIIITADDIVHYIKGDPRSNMYSSAKITRTDTGKGVIINQMTPENITEVTDEMYANALLTAGIEEAIVDIASPVKVSGHSALVGIYKAYDQGEGEKLDEERTEVANEELSIATNLAKKEGMDQEKVTELLTEIKKEIAEQNPATKEDIQQIVDEQMQKLEIQLSEEDRKLLYDLFEKMRELNINFDNVKSQLEDLANSVQEKISEAVGDKGFLQAVSDFFKNLIDSIKGIFS
ncbi:DUF1002 domain-containing protein [Cytobacillus sp. FSL W7-1323]|uniref:DUF1002 domain-containing protein n=1 Tax=Cytobacillus TaxID=2675230 RepID=UPI0027819176|nr:MULTISPECIES: DUF1002 domain-containing protein [Cytobacillus]MDQ0186488.1 uncharacterized protein YpuA (DUF1002 family) [Cytobacillus kochii]MEA1854099.1 DUF1002 domain-containing protein [Cytobacillus sp. OWB-43]MED1607852.1 DUF1002 domain-containing protein [Cytobacillus kochii]